MPIHGLLRVGGPAADATVLVFVANDGYTAEVPLSDMVACADHIVAFDPKDDLRTVLPNLSGNFQVKNLIEIQVKGGAPAAGGTLGIAAQGRLLCLPGREKVSFSIQLGDGSCFFG